jgi:glycosyltransferase involved in cell wall biosynthesis
MVHADFMLSLLHLVQHTRMGGCRAKVVNAKSAIVAEARNLAVAAALELGAEWLMFLDSDMIFPPETIVRLLAHEKAIVGATYPRRSRPLGFIGARADERPFSLEDRGLIEAARLPAGCLLIRASVFESLKAPYFRCAYDEETGLILSEDFYFCDLVRGLGIGVWCDMDLSRQLQHIGSCRFQLTEAESNVL